MYSQKTALKKTEKGSIIPMVLIFGSIFLFIFAGLIGFVVTQYHQSKQKAALNQALEIAEAGVNYARWHLLYSSNEFDFSGTYDFIDPEGGQIGHYVLDITPPQECSTTFSIKSTGWTDAYPNAKRTVLVKYGEPSLAQYAFLTNEDVWFGENEELRGPFHSNGGIRMDGTQNSLSTSAQPTYTCQRIHGCSPAQTKPGIWGEGNGGDDGLWEFPVPAIDFDSITLDLGELSSKAYESGYYFGPSGAYGYHIKFKNNGSFDLYKVTKLKPNVSGQDTDGAWHNESNDINKESFLASYPLTQDTCDEHNLIFIDDLKVWVDGVISEKATVVAAQFPDNPNTNSSIIINGNISRADPQDTLLALIAQKNILVPLYSPNILEIQAVMLAQKGAVQRYYYSNSYSPYNTRQRIMVRGSIISKKLWTWTWVSGSTVTSGYKETESYFEPDLIYNPPPFFPSSGELQFISWEEVQ